MRFVFFFSLFLSLCFLNSRLIFILSVSLSLFLSQTKSSKLGAVVVVAAGGRRGRRGRPLGGGAAPPCSSSPAAAEAAVAHRARSASSSASSSARSRRRCCRPRRGRLAPLRAFGSRSFFLLLRAASSCFLFLFFFVLFLFLLLLLCYLRLALLPGAEEPGEVCRGGRGGRGVPLRFGLLCPVVGSQQRVILFELLLVLRREGRKRESEFMEGEKKTFDGGWKQKKREKNSFLTLMALAEL